MHQHRLASSLLISTLLLLTACGGGVYRPAADVGFELDPAYEIDDADVEKAFAARPQLPERLRVSYYSFDPKRVEDLGATDSSLGTVDGSYPIPSMLVTGKGRFAGDPTAPMRYGEAARPVSIKKLRLLGWVLGHDVACVVESGIGTDPASQDAAIDAARTPLSQREAALLERYAAAMSPHYCRGCDSLCGAACPEGLSIAPALQFLMYERAYGWHERATRHYRALERPWAERCASCQACSEACPYGVDAAAGMRAARRLLAGDGRV